MRQASLLLAILTTFLGGCLLVAVMGAGNDEIATYRKSGDRYFYIDIGTYAGQTNTPWSRRLKIPLSCITWELINSGSMLVGEIPGTGNDGGPSCAYSWLKQFDPAWQWQVCKGTHG